MDNYAIADNFSLLAKLMDIHGENSFKSKTYAVAAFNIEKLPLQLKDTPREKLFSIKGIGDSVGKKVVEMLDTGSFSTLSEYIHKTPPGVLEMLNIKGLGPKKINTVWKELEIESIGELLYACTENRLLMYKGFGEKTQKNISDSIEFYLQNQGSHLYAQVEEVALALEKKLKEAFPDAKTSLTGAFRRQMETIDTIEFVTTVPSKDLKPGLLDLQFEVTEENEESISFKGPENLRVKFFLADSSTFYYQLFKTSSESEFFEGWNQSYPSQNNLYEDEESIFKGAGLNYISPYLRDKIAILERVKDRGVPEIIQPDDIKGIIHSHSNWSDGVNTIEEMADACIDKGYEYLVISDHSKSAFYANGLTEDRIREQHRYIDELNKKLSPFRIFKSIECDILNDGSLDYSDEILSTFDLVITSVHSNLKMTEEKAMMRVLKAINNPYTTILGHMTGRLLLSRSGYPLDHKKVIDACVVNHVVIELNAHPRRLDIDWRWIDYALEQGALLSIDPDAHSISGYKDTRYGVLSAQKGGLTKDRNLSSFSRSELEEYLEKRKAVKGI